MERIVRGIFLDLGGTFRIVEDNVPYKTAARKWLDYWSVPYVVR